MSKRIEIRLQVSPATEKIKDVLFGLDFRANFGRDDFSL
jgi:hypothetical protein